MAATLKESNKKESLGWKYKELEFDFKEYEQISMFEEEKNDLYNTKRNFKGKSV